jgi:hypothetical protein
VIQGSVSSVDPGIREGLPIGAIEDESLRAVLLTIART